MIVLLTISTTHEPASDLGFLLHKHPGRVQSFDESVGRAHIFYPEVSETRCTAALLLEVDPVGLVRGRKCPSGDGFALGQYVNDRPYAASSMLAMALKDVFRTRDRVQMFQPALTYRDDRLSGLNAAVLMEVIEHVDPPRLEALERTVFGHAVPGTVIVTTPNAEHNVRFDALPAGAMRHRDHRFEWTRAEFRSWAGKVAAAYAYTVRYLPVGTDDLEVGPPTQMAVFSKAVAS